MQLSVFALSDTCNLTFKHKHYFNNLHTFNVQILCTCHMHKGQNLTGDLNAVPCGLLELVELNVKKV